MPLLARSWTTRYLVCLLDPLSPPLREGSIGPPGRGTPHPVQCLASEIRYPLKKLTIPDPLPHSDALLVPHIPLAPASPPCHACAVPAPFQPAPSRPDLGGDSRRGGLRGCEGLSSRGTSRMPAQFAALRIPIPAYLPDMTPCDARPSPTGTPRLGEKRRLSRDDCFQEHTPACREPHHCLAPPRRRRRSSYDLHLQFGAKEEAPMGRRSSLTKTSNQGQPDPLRHPARRAPLGVKRRSLSPGERSVSGLLVRTADRWWRLALWRAHPIRNARSRDPLFSFQGPMGAGCKAAVRHSLVRPPPGKSHILRLRPRCHQAT
jgi:hypothetical protein